LIRIAALLCSVALTGCIFAEPPSREVQQSPPIINVPLVSPQTTEVLRVSPMDSSILFSIPFHSEDRDEQLWYAGRINYGLPTERWADPVVGRIPPSTFSDDSRSISFSWTPSNSSEPCFQFTLIVCHDHNFSLGNDGPDGGPSPQFVCRSQAVKENDLAMVTWWVNYGDIDAAPSLVECPGPETTGGG